MVFDDVLSEVDKILRIIKLFAICYWNIYNKFNASNFIIVQTRISVYLANLLTRRKRKRRKEGRRELVLFIFIIIAINQSYQFHVPLFRFSRMRVARKRNSRGCVFPHLRGEKSCK